MASASDRAVGGWKKSATPALEPDAGHASMGQMAVASDSDAGGAGAPSLSARHSRFPRKSVLLGMLASGLVIADTVRPAAAASASEPGYVAAWAPSTAYTAATQVISPDNGVVSANVAHTSSASYVTDASKWTLGSAYDGAGVSARAYGAVGDGVTLDHVAINAAITANPGRDIHLSNGPDGAAIYQIDADYINGKGIRLNKPGTRLILDSGVTIRVKPNGLDWYNAITVTAADCAVTGGAIVGDVGYHTGSTGEWGHGINITDTAHRFKVQGTRISKCWGDGIKVCDTGYLTGKKPSDVSIIDVVCDDNRRHGLSVTSALRLHVLGGSFLNTGLTARTIPIAGINIEPNSGKLNDVIDFSIIGSLVQGNGGRGFTVHPSGRTVTGTVQGVRAIDNVLEGFSTETTAEVEFVGCSAIGNKDGFVVEKSTAGRNVITGCTADRNTRFGFLILTFGDVIGCHATNNGLSGFMFQGQATATACTATGNNTAGSYYAQISVLNGTAVRLVGCVSSVGDNATKPTRGFDVKDGSSGTRFLSCDTVGTFSVAAFQDLGAGTVAFPVPGAAKAPAISSPTAPTATYNQAAETSMKAAVDAIRVALKNYGITA